MQKDLSKCMLKSFLTDVEKILYFCYGEVDDRKSADEGMSRNLR